MKKINKFTFTIVFTSKKNVDRINPPPSIKKHNPPSKLRLMQMNVLTNNTDTLSIGAKLWTNQKRQTNRPKV